jgi:acetyltransferase-like isoleucine patch superfamily enzyme
LNKLIRKFLEAIDDPIIRPIVKWLWPRHRVPRKGYQWSYKILRNYFFFQKILRVNGAVPWPVDFRSRVSDWKKIEKGICCNPGDSMGVYINAHGGLKLGNNVNIGPNTIITTTNHYKYDDRKLSDIKGVEIGDNVWIGSNCSIVAGSKIGSNVTIGACCYISSEIPSNSTVMAIESNLKIIPKTKAYEWDCTKEELN